MGRCRMEKSRWVLAMIAVALSVAWAAWPVAADGPPDAPQDVQVISTGQSRYDLPQVRMVWSGGDVTGYRIYVGPDASPPGGAPLFDLSADTTSYDFEVAAQSPSGQFCFWVTAYIDGGESSPAGGDCIAVDTLDTSSGLSTDPAALTASLPYATRSYRLSYLPARGAFVFNFIIDPGAAGDLQSQFEQAMAAAQDFIRGTGVEPDALPIEWRHS
jgi:hypothetical protein